MLKTRYIKIQVTDLDNNRYFISAFDETDRNLFLRPGSTYFLIIIAKVITAQ